MTKKNVLLVSSVYIVYFVTVLLVSALCKSTWCKVREDDIFGILFFIFTPLIFVFFFSLITYKMKEGVFRAWWGFARWFAPVIIVVTLLQNTAHTPSGFGGVASGAFDFALLFILYALFILISLIRIARAYTRTK